MHNLRIGDRVQVAPAQFSPVFLFTHRNRQTTFRFLRICASHACISLSASHLLYVNDRLLPARLVRRGEFIHLADGSPTVVISVQTVSDVGLFNPHTLHGDIVVDGIHASTYTDAIHPRSAHVLLSPFRLGFHVFDSLLFLSKYIIISWHYFLALFLPLVFALV